MSNTNLSIIIPCYNAEKYIQKCITSITEQTYTKLEIIIIDDGSTDQSGNICDRLASSDARIKVIHQPNQGSSLTRKRGIELATGDCVTFVDADDWIHPKMYEIMMEGMIKENADIAQCGWCDAYLNKRTGEIALKHLKTDQINNEYIKYDRIKGVLKILEDTQWRSFMWNKIFRKVLFQGIEFPIGRFLDDDTTIMHQLFHKANLTIYFPSEFYYYLRGSLTQVKDDVKRSKDIIDRTDAKLRL